MFMGIVHNVQLQCCCCSGHVAEYVTTCMAYHLQPTYSRAHYALYDMSTTHSAHIAT